MKLLLFCTSAKELLWFNHKYADGNKFFMDGAYNRVLDDCPDFYVNGKVVAECDFKVEKVTYELYGDLDWQHDYLPTTDTLSIVNLESESCMDREEISERLNHKDGYAIHIENLNIFDTPKNVSDYHSFSDYGGLLITHELNYTPRNMMRVSVSNWDYGFFDWKDVDVLLPISPNDLCKILNGEKTIEFRKRVLKVMLNNEVDENE